MVDWLAYTIIGGSLVMAVWCLFSAARDRTLVHAQLVGLGVVELVVLVQVVLGIAQAGEPSSPATFVGYLLASALVLPAGVVLAYLEPTKWGTVIVGVAALVLPVLVLRLQQVWGA